MKNLIYILLTITIILTMVSCGSSHRNSSMNTSMPDNTDPPIVDERLSMIYEATDSNLSPSVAVNIRRPAQIYNQTVVVEDNVEKTITLTIGSEELTYYYSDTIYRDLNNECVYRYRLDSDDIISWYTLKDGKLNTISHSNGIAEIDIAENDSVETIREKLEKVVTEWFDPSQYEHVDVATADYDPDYYHFSYYNEINGCETNSVSVMLDNGKINAIMFSGCNFEENEVRFSMSVANDLILLKVKDMYESSKSKVVSVDAENVTKNVVRYNGEACILIRGIRSQVSLDTGKLSDSSCTLLIPLSLLQTP